ncbi:MAG TPA: zinc ribbon domain-containing protein [Lacunisphaera sp.]|nr:zinc ribbon domain-containing protein [Lacunisphaera sp.]
MSQRFLPPGECPVCGDEVPKGAKACPGCGADERSGWDEEDTRYDGLDLPDEAFGDDRKSQPTPLTGRDPVWIALAVLVTLALILTFLFR